jgi:hypothetical protein
MLEDKTPLPSLLMNLLVQFGVKNVDMAWKSLLTGLESQLKEALHPEIKPKTPEIVLTNTIETQVSLPAKKVMKKTPPPIAPVPEPEPEKVVSDKKMADLSKRKMHKEAIAKRKEMLDAQGINGRQLLTADAMKKWIDDGKTYWDIAEQTGVPDTDISVLAKSFGLQSKVSKLIAFKR